jgi:hypothetical protein
LRWPDGLDVSTSQASASAKAPSVRLMMWRASKLFSRSEGSEAALSLDTRLKLPSSQVSGSPASSATATLPAGSRPYSIGERVCCAASGVVYVSKLLQ